MNLQYALDELSRNVTNIEGYFVYVLKDYERAVQDLPIDEFQIYDIEIEHEVSEITLLTNEKSNLPENNKSLTAVELLHKLTKLMPKHKDYILFSGSAKVELADDYWARHDIPLIAMGFDHENKRIAFVQEGNKNS